MTDNIQMTITQHDDRRYYFAVLDENGAQYPVTQFTEIEFTLANSVKGTRLLTRKYTTSEIHHAPDNNIYFDILSEDSGALPVGLLYAELRGMVGHTGQTMSAGTANVIDTRIGDGP